MNQILYKFKLKRWMTIPLLVLLLITGLPWLGHAQSKILKGKVIDSKDQSMLVGVNVFIKTTNKGTTTDADGVFTLEANPGDIITFSYIGYNNKEFTYNGQGFIDVMLDGNNVSLNEIVVTGFGQQKKVNLSGAVDAVDRKVLENRPIQTVGQGLQGVVPNLNIDFVSGEPGVAPKINIRGFTSINGGSPLVIVDGVPTDAVELNFISPDDIDNISVLKDASSAAIYGSRAAYGVILITTKKGTTEKININYNNNFSWSKPTVLPNKITDPYIYTRLLETSTDNTPWDNQNFSDETYQWARERSDNPSLPSVRVNPNDPSLWEYMGDKDWTKEYLDNYTLSQKHSISLGGKANKTSFYLSGSYNTQTGAVKIAEDKFDRYTVRGNVNFQPYKWLSVGNNTAISLTERAKPTNLSIFDIYNLFPTSYDKNPDGTWANTDVGRMGARLTNGGKAKHKANSFQTTFSGEASFLERMIRLNADFTARRVNEDSSAYLSKYKIGYGPNDVREEGNNTAQRVAAFETYTVFNTYLTFEKNLGRHYLNAIAGYNQESNRYEWFKAQRDKVISSSLPSIGLATGESVVDERITDWAIRGAFYRLNYIFDNKYIFELNGRYDGSSKFPKDKRFGFFPSASVAWRVDSEKFWEPLSKVIDVFKIRASYGSLGNQFVKEYGYIPTMNSSQGNYLIDGSLPQTVSSPQMISPNYTWEKVSSQNLGVDLAFLNQRITASFDIYRRDTKGMLMPGKELPDVLGAVEPSENSADLKTKGWEVALGYNNSIQLGGKPLAFNSRFTLADSRSYITRFDNPSNSLTQYYEGQELGEIWGLKSDGLFKSQEEIDALDETALIPWGALSIVPGWPKYQDLDGNNIIEKGQTVDDPKDLSKIGNITPRLRYGVDLSLSYSGFDMRIFFQGVGKMDYYPQNYLYWGFYQQPYAGGYSHLTDFYRGADESEADRARHSQSYINAGLANANTDAKYPVLQSWLADRNLGERIDESLGLAIPQTQYMLNGAYLRLKNLTFGYTFKGSWLEKANISKLRIYVSGENLHEWSQVKKFFDPEAITDNVAKSDPGKSTSDIGWGYAYPFQRQFSFGLNVQF